MSLLTIITDVADRLGLARPDTVIAATDQNTRNLLGFAQAEGYDLMRRASWSALTSEKTFTTVAAAAQTSAIPTDFAWYIEGTMFNRTSRREVAGPVSESDWQRIQASLVTMVNPAFRFRGGSILITPTPTAGDTVAYEYIRNTWCLSSIAAPQSAWTADADTGVLDEELHKLGIVWRFKKSKGLDYSEEFRTYEVAVAQAIARDGAKPRIDTSPSTMERVPMAPQVPETITY